MKKLYIVATLIAAMGMSSLPSRADAASQVVISPGNWELNGSSSVVNDRGRRAVKLRLTSGTRIVSDKAADLFNANKGKYAKICILSRAGSKAPDGLIINAKAVQPGYKSFKYASDNYATRCTRQLIAETQQSGWRKVSINQYGYVGDRIDFVRSVTISVE